MTFSYEEYIDTHGILGDIFSFLGIQDSFKKQYFVNLDQNQLTNEEEDEVFDHISLGHEMNCINVKSTTSRPSTIIQALAKIGGILSILQLLQLVTVYQKIIFERQLQQEIGKFITPFMIKHQQLQEDIPGEVKNINQEQRQQKEQQLEDLSKTKQLDNSIINDQEGLQKQPDGNSENKVTINNRKEQQIETPKLQFPQRNKVVCTVLGLAYETLGLGQVSGFLEQFFQ